MIDDARLRELANLYSHSARYWDSRVIPVSRLITVEEVVELAEYMLLKREEEAVKRLTSKNGRARF